ncbi:hypothetical protein DITRI_Ditri12bG0135400 [Diplodiscus trichospermus]
MLDQGRENRFGLEGCGSIEEGRSLSRTRNLLRSWLRNTMPFWHPKLSSNRFLVFWDLVSTRQASNFYLLVLPKLVWVHHLYIDRKFLTLVTHKESLESKVNETKAMVKFQLKKVLCMGVAVGNCSMEEKQIFRKVQLSVNFLVSLLKKNWQNASS